MKCQNRSQWLAALLVLGIAGGLSGCAATKCFAQSSFVPQNRQSSFSQSPNSFSPQDSIPGQSLTRSSLGEFDEVSHVDDVSWQVRRRANAICWEIYRYQRHRHDFKSVYREAYEMLKTAEYVHDLIHNHGRRSRVRAEVQVLDQLFHHIEGDLALWANSDRQFHVSFHSPENGVRTLQKMMERLENTLHHLMQDIGINRSGAPRSESSGLTPPPSPRNNAAPNGDGLRDPRADIDSGFRQNDRDRRTPDLDNRNRPFSSDDRVRRDQRDDRRRNVPFDQPLIARP
jgi:hypothetical protein